MTIRAGHVELPVSDPMASLLWYTETLGFHLEANQGDRFIWLTLGGFSLLLRPGVALTSDDDSAVPCIVLYTSDLVATSATLEKRGIDFIRDGNCLHFRDLDGHWFQLVDPEDDHSGGPN